jgi:nucleoid DNA-binding protein
MKNKRFTKKDIVRYIFDNNKWSSTSKADIERTINLFIDFFQIELACDCTIELRGLGTFSIKTIKERERVWKLKYDKCEQLKFIPERKSVRFKPSITLRKLLNKQKQEEQNKKNEVKDASKPAETDLNPLKNATKEEIKEAIYLISEEAKRTTKIDWFK